MNNCLKKAKSTNKQSKKNHVCSDKNNELSSEKDTPPVLSSSEIDYNFPETNGHCEVSVPSPDDAALPNDSLCPLVSVESKGLNTVDECAEDASTQISAVNHLKINKPNSENTAEEVPGIVKDKKKVPSTKKSKNGEKEAKNKLLTDFFQVRRSSRKILWAAQFQKQKLIEEAITSGSEEGFEVKEFGDKGRGVITKKEIRRDDFVLEYSGELLNFTEAKKRESVYATRSDIGCYMYYFKYKDKQFCVDATKENGRLGRLVNHSKKGGNLKTRPFFIDEYPHLIFVATRDISPGEELLYDYGDRSKKSLESYPWLAT